MEWKEYLLTAPISPAYIAGMEGNCLLTMRVATSCQGCGRETVEAHMIERTEGQLMVVCGDCCEEKLREQGGSAHQAIRVKTSCG